MRVRGHQRGVQADEGRGARLARRVHPQGHRKHGHRPGAGLSAPAPPPLI